MTKHIPIRVIAILISISAMMLAANPLSNFIQANPTTIVLGFGFLLRIFLAGVADVSLGTVRTIVVFRVYKFLAPTIGFFEIIIWLIAAGQVLGNLDQ